MFSHVITQEEHVTGQEWRRVISSISAASLSLLSCFLDGLTEQSLQTLLSGRYLSPQTLWKADQVIGARRKRLRFTKGRCRNALGELLSIWYLVGSEYIPEAWPVLTF